MLGEHSISINILQKIAGGPTNIWLAIRPWGEGLRNLKLVFWIERGFGLRNVGKPKLPHSVTI